MSTVQSKEEEILKHLITAFNLFNELETQHPNEQQDFIDGIHKCQYVLSMRFARKAYPNIFPTKQDNPTYGGIAQLEEATSLSLVQ